jgi:hypothetical protein
VAYRVSQLRLLTTLAETAAQHILRDGIELDVDVPTVLLPGHTTDRIVQYVCLACVHSTHSLSAAADHQLLWSGSCMPWRLHGNVSWGGVILQEPHRAVAQQNRHLPKGIYSSWWSNGSPAHMYGLRATVWVTEVNGQPAPDLNTYVDDRHAAPSA